MDFVGRSYMLVTREISRVDRKRSRDFDSVSTVN